MPLPTSDAAWALRYPDTRSGSRLLVSLPPDMLHDLNVAAKGVDLSGAEFVRRALTRELAAVIRANPAAARSFRGQLPGSEA